MPSHIHVMLGFIISPTTETTPEKLNAPHDGKNHKN